MNICPKPLATAESWEWIRLHSHHKDGRQPLSGGVMEQPAPFIMAMDIINQALAKEESDAP